MRNRFRRFNCVLYFIGNLLMILGAITLIPLLIVIIYWGQYEDGWKTVYAFSLSAVISFGIGIVLRNVARPSPIDTPGSMLICGLSWIVASAVGAIPFVVTIEASYLDAYFETMSGYTTTGITVFAGLDDMPRSILFWRSLTQWIGGVGILSFFLAITFRSGGAHHVFGAESHKISSGRPVPGLFNTLKILWGIYAGFTLASMVALTLEGMPSFDAVCHSLTALSTGGFSPYDASIEYYKNIGHSNYRLIEYTLTFFMMLGGMNFLIHYRVVTGDLKALWDNVEVRYWRRIVIGFTVLIMIDVLYRAGIFGLVFSKSEGFSWSTVEEAFRLTIFQVISLITTTGFGTRDINASYFPQLTKQLFLVMMIIGGCVGSTGGGIKVMRIAILNKLITRELFKLRSPSKASSAVVIDGKPVSDDEVHRTSALFFTWMGLLLFGGLVSAFFSDQNALASFSGMFSALGNIGPCYISVPDMIELNPVVKITYIFGMLAGRLEILPVLLIFSTKAWR